MDAAGGSMISALGTVVRLSECEGTPHKSKTGLSYVGMESKVSYEDEAALVISVNEGGPARRRNTAGEIDHGGDGVSIAGETRAGAERIRRENERL
jgi:hypothetical protein